MNSNGDYQDDYQQQEQIPQEENASEVFYELIRLGIAEDVASQVDGLVVNGVLSAADITEKVTAELVNLPTDLMNQITNELVSSDVSNLKNKAAYLIGLIKTQKKKVPGLSTSDSSNQLQQGEVKQEAVIDQSTLNITYGKHYKGLSLGPSDNEEAIKRILLRTGYRLDLTPGQRQYGPPPNWPEDSKPGRGCEVFLGGLLRETFEDTLVPWLEECGTIFDLRIMTNPDNGANKGFAFCIFTDKDAANTCVRKLHGKAMGRNRVLKVNVHSPNTRLFVGGVDKTRDRNQIMQAIGEVTDGLVDVILKGDTEHPYNKHRGFVFLDYSEHKHASTAIKRLMLPTTTIFGKNLFADWAEPLAEVSDEIMATVKVLYVKGLTASVTEDILKDRFSPYGPIDSVKKLKDYAFVHFQQRDDALQAMNDLNMMRVDDATLEVTLAKPGGKKKDPSRGGFGGGPGGPMMRGRGGGMRGGMPPMMGGRGGPRGGFGMRGGAPGRGGRGGPPRGGARGGGGRGGGAPRMDYGGGYDSYGGDYEDGYSAPSRGLGSAGYGGGYGGASSYSGGSSSYGGGGASYGGGGASYGGGGASYGGGGSLGAGGRGASRGSPRVGSGGYGGQRGSRGASNGRGHRGGGGGGSSYGGGLGGRGGMKRSAPPSIAPLGYSGYAAPEAKRTKSYDDWGAAPITQQPLGYQGYGASSQATDSSWYSDSY